MDDFIADIAAVATRWDAAAQPFEDGPVHEQITQLTNAIAGVGEAWSGSWLGYQASLYIDGLRPRRPDEYFDSQWPRGAIFHRTRGPWRHYSYDEVRHAIMARAACSAGAARQPGPEQQVPAGPG